MPRAGDEHGLPRRQQVDHASLPGAMAIGGVQEDIGVAGLQQRLEAAFNVGNDVIQARVAVVQWLAAHGLHDFAGDVGGAG